MSTPPEKTPEQVQDLYTQSDITTRCRFSKSHLYNLIERGHFPPAALRCGPRFTRWKASEVQAWLADPQGWIDANTTGAQAVAA